MRFVYKPIRQHSGGFWKNLFRNTRKVREEANVEMERRRKARVISHGPSPSQRGGKSYIPSYKQIQKRMQNKTRQTRQDKRPPSRTFGKRQKDRNDEMLKNRYKEMGRRTMDIPIIPIREFTKHGKVKRTVFPRKRYYNPWSEFTDDFE